MTVNEFRNLKHGNKIQDHRGSNYIVHNNHRSRGIIVVVRTDVVQECNCSEWKLLNYNPVDIQIGPGRYEVVVHRKLD